MHGYAFNFTLVAIPAMQWYICKDTVLISHWLQFPLMRWYAMRRIESIRIEWIHVLHALVLNGCVLKGYVWNDVSWYAWYQWYANNIQKNPATKRLSGKKTKQKVKESNPCAILCFLVSFCLAWQKQQNEGDSQIRSPVSPIPKALWCEFLFC